MKTPQHHSRRCHDARTVQIHDHFTFRARTLRISRKAGLGQPPMKASGEVLAAGPDPSGNLGPFFSGPWIEEGYPGAGHIGCVPRYQREAVLKSCGCQEAIDCRDGGTRLDRCGCDGAPTIRDRFVNE